MKTSNECLFCQRTDEKKHRIIAENKSCYARWDNFAVSDGHAEIVTKRHVVSYFDLTKVEISDMHNLLVQIQKKIENLHNPDGYTIGCNEGEAAGRTIPHVHMHIIPRYEDDVENPRGGIRNIIPGKGNY